MDYRPFWLIKIAYLGILFTIVTAFSACSTPPTGTPIPTAQVIDLFYTPPLDYIREDIASCLNSLNTISAYLHQQSSSITSLQPGDVLLHLGEADWGENDYFATQIGIQNISFIINAANPLESIGFDELKAIYTGRQSSWDNNGSGGNQISIWTYPEGSELTKWLIVALLGSIRITPDAKLAPNPSAVLDTVSKDKFAIGYLPDASLEYADPILSSQIKVLNLEKKPEELPTAPVLAYLKEEPSGAVRDLLVCLRDK